MADQDQEDRRDPGRRRAGYHYHSLFWAVVLIGAGIVWLLANLGVVSGANFSALVRLWPVLLIGIGADILVGHRSPGLGALIGAGTVVAIVVLMLVGPAAGLSQKAELRTERFTASVDGASSARVELGLSRYASKVSASSAADPLLVADVTYSGTMDFRVSGDADKNVVLRQSSDGGGWFGWWQEGREARWDIGINPVVPLVLAVDGGSGSADLDLGGLSLRRLAVDAGSGAMKIRLPSPDREFEMDLEAGSGAMEVRVADGARGKLSLDLSSGSFDLVVGENADAEVRVAGGSGSFRAEFAQGSSVRVEVRDSGSGSVNLPSYYVRVGGGDDDEGVWETPGFAEATYKVILIIEDMGSGGISVL